MPEFDLFFAAGSTRVMDRIFQGVFSAGGPFTVPGTTAFSPR